MNKNKRSKAGRFKEKVIHVTAWISAILIPLGFIFRSFEWPGGSIIYLLGTLLFALFFAPLYFFTPRKFSNPFVPWWINALAGITFIPLLLATIFKLQHYPYADLLYIFGNLSLGILMAAFIFSSYKIKIKRPVYMGLLSGILVISMTQLTTKITGNEDEKNIYAEYFQRLNTTNRELSETLQEQGLNQPSVIKKIISAENQLAQTLSKDSSRPPSIQDTLPLNLNTQVPWDFYYETDYRSIFLPIISELRPVFKSCRVDFDMDFLQMEGLADTTYIKNHLFGVDGGTLFLFCEFSKSLTYAAVLKKHGSLKPSVVVSIQEAHNKIYLEWQSRQQKREQSQEFFGMFALSLLVSLFFFFIPTLPLSDAWKTRFILLSLVILFEFVLLVVDQLLGMNSNNLYLILGANILLAIGLVWIDGFVRKNFLAWYED